MDSAQQALDVRQSQVRFIDSALAERGARINTLRTMMARGAIGEPVFQDAQAQYLDNLARKQDVALGIQVSKQQLTDAKTTLAKLKLEARHALQHDISELELQIAQQSVVYRSHVAAVSIIDSDPIVPRRAATRL